MTRGIHDSHGIRPQAVLGPAGTPLAPFLNRFLKMLGLLLSILMTVALAQEISVSETTAGLLYRLYGERPFDEQPIPLSTLTVTAKNEISSVGILQADSLICKGPCTRNAGSDRLWLRIRFKDNSLATLELSGIETARIEHLYSKSKPEPTIRNRVVTHGAQREPVLVRTTEPGNSSFQSLGNPTDLAEILGFHLIRVYASQSRKLSREIGTMVTTGIRAESVRN